MKLTISTNNIQDKKMYLEGKEIDLLDFGTVVRTEQRSKEYNTDTMFFLPEESLNVDVLEKYHIDYTTYKKICNVINHEIDHSIIF